MKKFLRFCVLACTLCCLPASSSFGNLKQQENKTPMEKPEQPSTYNIIKDKTVSMLTLILTYMGLEAYFKRARTQEAQQKQTKPTVNPQQATPQENPDK
ncbi:MAG: hypothetical protein V1855_03340 [bacterium]